MTPQALFNHKRKTRACNRMFLYYAMVSLFCVYFSRGVIIFEGSHYIRAVIYYKLLGVLIQIEALPGLGVECAIGAHANTLKRYALKGVRQVEVGVQGRSPGKFCKFA